MENKRGQGMSISTVILLILGLVILVVLILGFSMGWTKFAPFLTGNNLNNIKNSCTTYCSLNDNYNFCSLKVDVKDGTNDKFQATCNELATTALYKNRGYGIEECPGLCS